MQKQKEMIAFVSKSIEHEASTKEVLAFFSDKNSVCKSLEDCYKKFESETTKHIFCNEMYQVSGCVAIVTIQEKYGPFVVNQSVSFFTQNVRKPIKEDEMSLIMDNLPEIVDGYDTMSKISHAKRMIEWCQIGNAEYTANRLSIICDKILSTNPSQITYKNNKFFVDSKSGELTIFWWLAQQYIEYYAQAYYAGEGVKFLQAYDGFLQKNMEKFVNGLEWQTMQPVLTEKHQEVLNIVDSLVESVQSQPQSDTSRF